MKKIFFSILALALPLLSRAQGLQDSFDSNLFTAGENLGYDPTNRGDAFINTLTGKIITTLLGFVGVIFFIMIFIAGYQWLMSGGNADSIKKAKQRLINSIIGLVVVLAAYLITIFIYTQIKTITK